MKLLVIDGNSIVNRAFFGIKLLTTHQCHLRIPQHPSEAQRGGGPRRGGLRL